MYGVQKCICIEIKGNKGNEIKRYEKQKENKDKYCK